MLIDGGLDKETVVYLSYGILLSWKKDGVSLSFATKEPKWRPFRLSEMGHFQNNEYMLALI